MDNQFPPLIPEDMSCPFCGDEYNHVKWVQVQNPIHAVRVTPYGEDEYSVIEYADDPERALHATRRYVALIRFQCESGCEYEVSFLQHKGMMTTETREIVRAQA